MATENDNLQAVAGRLAALDDKITLTISRLRTRNRVVFILAILSMVAIGGWLYYAHQRFSNDVNPELAAGLAQGYIQTNLPDAAAQLEQSLKENAPAVVAAGEKQLRALPGQLAAQFRGSLSRTIAEQMPKLQELVYQKLKDGLEAARTTAQAMPGRTDEERFHAMADALTETYRTETLKFVDEQYAQYRSSSANIMATLEVLAENKNLTPMQKSHRQLLCTFLDLAAEYDTNSSATPAKALR